MRSIFKGHLRFQLLTIPVKVYNAEETQDKVKLNLFHKGCGGAVGKKDYCKSCNVDLTSEQIYRGFKISDDAVVEITDDDIANVKLESTKIIDIVGFVDKSEIPVMFYQKPYFIGPDGKLGEQTYDVLKSAIETSGKIAIGKVVVNSGREDQVAITVEDDCLVMCIIRYKDEVRKSVDVPKLNAVTKSPEDQTKLAVDLIESMACNFADLSVINEYNAKLKEVIDLKVQGKLTQIPAVDSSPKAPAVDIMAALKASMAIIKPNNATMKVELPKEKEDKKSTSSKKKLVNK